MGYCTITEVERLLGNALTSATDPTNQNRRNLLQIGKVRDKNSIPDSTVNQYIQWAGHEIDSTLSQMYRTPICEYADFQQNIFADVTEYNSYIILERNCPLSVGDIVILTQDGIEERHEIETVVGDGLFSTIDPIEYEFTSGARVIRVKFPDPLPWICSRLAASNVYDKYFAAQVSPNISEYGKFLRDQARQKINDLLNGRAILRGVPRVGRRLYDPTLSEQYNLPIGQDGQRDTDKLG